MDLNLFFALLAAILLGSLIGLERELYFINLPDTKIKKRVLDIRSHILISFLGFISAFLMSFQDFGYRVLGLLVFAIISFFLLTGYILEFKEYRFLGITSELSSIMTFLIGFLCLENLSLAVVVGVLTRLILSLKEKIRLFTDKIKAEEFRATMKFLIIAFVVLPILPKEPIDPWNVVSLYDTWLMVVFISGISFVGYILTKIFGTEKGIGLTAIIGGLASSTAVTTSMANQSKKNEKIVNPFVFGVVIASAVMFVRVGFEVLVINNGLLKKVIFPLSVLVFSSLCVLVFLFLSEKKKLKKERKHEKIPLSSPFQFLPALKFGIFYVFVLLISHFSHKFLGNSGIYLSSALAGLADVDAITISMSKLSRSGEILDSVATKSMMISVFSNTLVKGSIAFFFGGKDFSRRVAVSFGFVIIAGVVSLFFV